MRKEIKNRQSQTPLLNKKPYSFQDPLFASFGSKPAQNIGQKKYDETKRNYMGKQMDSKSQQKYIDEAISISNRFQLLTQMMKISKYLLDPSILFVNTQNKVKIQTLIECKSKQENLESRIICQNALKYLTFIQVLDQEEQQSRKFEENLAIDQNQRKINSEFRIQNQSTQTVSKSKNKQFTSVRFNKQSQETHKESQQYTKNKKISDNKNSNNSFRSHEIQKSFIDKHSNNKMRSNSETVEKMFQNIQTPRITNNEGPHLSQFVSFHGQKNQNNQLNNHQPFRKQIPFRKPQLLEGKQVIDSDNDPYNRHKQKLNDKAIQQRTLNYEVNTKLSTSQSRSKKQSEKQKQIKISQCQQNNQKKAKIAKDAIHKNVEKSLATKTVDKTTQFQKMLKMTSSRVDPL